MFLRLFLHFFFPPSRSSSLSFLISPLLFISLFISSINKFSPPPPLLSSFFSLLPLFHSLFSHFYLHSAVLLPPPFFLSSSRLPSLFLRIPSFPLPSFLLLLLLPFSFSPLFPLFLVPSFPSYSHSNFFFSLFLPLFFLFSIPSLLYSSFPLLLPYSSSPIPALSPSFSLSLPPPSFRQAQRGAGGVACSGAVTRAPPDD